MYCKWGYSIVKTKSVICLAKIRKDFTSSGTFFAKCLTNFIEDEFTEIQIYDTQSKFAKICYNAANISTPFIQTK